MIYKCRSLHASYQLSLTSIASASEAFALCATGCTFFVGNSFYALETWPKSRPRPPMLFYGRNVRRFTLFKAKYENLIRISHHLTLPILITCRDGSVDHLVEICRKGVNQLGGWRYDTEIVVTARTKRCVRHIIAAKWRLSPLCHPLA